MSQEMVAIDYDDIRETPSTSATLFVIETGDGQIPDLEQWVPNSLIQEIDRDHNQVWLPEWFAIRENLI